MRRGALVAALALVATLSACGEDRGGAGFQCERNSQCQAPLVCRLTRCRNECATARDCPIGSLCVVDGQGIGSCRLPEESTCALNSDCPEDLVCQSGQCTNECAEDRDCPPGAVCQDMGCVDLAETICVFDSDCQRVVGGEGLVCAQDERCRAQCRGDVDCRPGEACDDEGVCELVPTTMDAGLRDGGGVDGGGVDGGTPDGGMVDAGDPDAGPPGGPTCVTVMDCPSVPTANAACVAGVCTITGCRNGLTDCDGDFLTGCESYLPTDKNNCGMCGNPCASGELCVGTCEPGVVTQIDAGRRISCALITSGATSGYVLCWGACGAGQCGDGSAMGPGLDLREAPVVVQGITTAREITIGNAEAVDSHACARLADGTVSCWGANQWGQTGSSAGTDQRSPVAVPGLSNVVEIAAGAAFTCARRMDGTVWCWGLGGDQLGAGGGVFGAQPTPLQVMGLSGATSLMSTGEAYMCAGTGPSTYRCWGRFGWPMGLPMMAGSPTAVDSVGVNPAMLTGLSGSGLNPRSPFNPSVAFGLDGAGAVYCWGSTHSSLCGADNTETNIPTSIPTLGAGFSQVAAGQQTAMAVRSTGELFCWGWNDTRICGFGAVPGTVSPPTQHPTINDVTQAAVGWTHGCVLRSSGEVWCSGTLGVGNGAGSSAVMDRVLGL